MRSHPPCRESGCALGRGGNTRSGVRGPRTSSLLAASFTSVPGALYAMALVNVSLAAEQWVEHGPRREASTVHAALQRAWPPDCGLECCWLGVEVARQPRAHGACAAATRAHWWRRAALAACGLTANSANSEYAAHQGPSAP